MLVAAAVCPNPPLLVPELGIGLGPEIDALRTECAAVVQRLQGADASIIDHHCSDRPVPRVRSLLGLGSRRP